jgi:glycosyltransferase involved in cell wall biosynthesis
MRVCVDAMVGAAGIATYSRGVIEALRPDVALTAKRGLVARAAWREWHLPRVEADVLLVTSPELPLRRLPVPAAVVVHDIVPLTHPELVSRVQRARFKALLPRVLARADAVVSVSAATRDEMRARLGVDSVVIGQGPSPFPMLPRKPSDYLLYVGETFPRKNLETVKAAANARLVVVGPGTKFVSDERLAELYAGASALVLPSLAEGFGRTALDAMARGVPVIASDIPALRELCGDAALLVDQPREPAAWARAIEELPARAAALSKLGLERAQRYDWSVVGRELRALLAGL